MANGNGNNINTDDAAAAAAAAATTTATTTVQQQQQQQLTGDGIGACGDAKQTAATATRVNDLVADLWLNGSSNNSNSSRGDYTNIRATTTATTAAAAPTATNSSSSSTAASSTFSFKHFLNSSGTVIAPSSTVTSLDAACGTSGGSVCSTATSLQTSTGARPKVPQSASMQPDLNGSAASKMKRSPRFSSFDSQASLAEYAACGGVAGAAGGNTRLRPDLRLEVERGGVVLDDDDDDHVGLAQVRNSRLYDERADDDIFPSAASNLQAGNSRYVPRSYSSYDMPPPASSSSLSSSPRRRPALRPNRLVLAATPKMKLDLPLDTSNVAAAASSALPDFVQDHLPDAWCQEPHLSASPPNSPLGAAEAPSCSGASGGLNPLQLPSAAGLPCSAVLPAGSEAGGSTGKMLPDFLSDGPILHSSQRLADVAIGLPSNSIDSPPQEPDGGGGGSLQLSSLRQENERLQRELQEMRVELSSQTRRAHDWEQQLLALTDARRRDTLAAAAHTQTTQRLRRQVAQLEAELFALRDGAGSEQLLGGATAAAAAPVMTPGSSHSHSSSGGSNTSRPSRTHQLSRDLLRAADNAEQNLR
ncbi:hypothetical protein KR044_001452 [Drosophila immigrans]|nr:hypothetical protein KR044_001452 [Drosophila immigrans]